MSRIRPATVLLAVFLLAPAFTSLATAANWEPDSGDWAVYHRSVDHRGATSAVSAFTTSVSDVRVKWQRSDDPGYWVPPVAADLDLDGIAEIVAVVGNASADPGNPSNPVSVESGLNVINGATGAMKWSVAPETGYLDFYSPALGDIDGDGRGEIVYFHGQPLTGSSLTNHILAYEADGTQKWSYSDSNWGTRVPLPLTAMTIGDVDGESAKNEVVMTLLLATVTTTISGGKVLIAGTNPEYRLLALNGEGSTATNAWSPKVFTGKATASNVALGDLDADGTLDMVYGAGAKSGTLIETSAAKITVSADFEDNKIKGYLGSSNPASTFEFTATGFFPGELGTAPVIADLDADGSPEIIQPLWVRNYPPTASDTSVVLVLNRDGTEKWRTTLNAAINALVAQPPPVVTDLNGDGKLDIVVQTSNGDANNRYRMIALKHDGTVLWRSPNLGREMTSVPAAGDITGDGKPEVLGMFGSGIGTTDTQTLVVFNGQTGAEMFRKAFDVGATVGGPLLVDLDGDDDGRLEILLNTGFWGSPGKLIALEPELPDLRVTALSFGSTEHLHGVSETVSATVANLGSRTASSAVVRLTEDGATVGDQSVTIAAGGSTVVSFTWTPANLGTRTLRIEADPAKAVPEWVETNNRVQGDVTVRAPELRFAAADPVFSDPLPGEGDTIQVSVTLSNGGGKDATNVLVRFAEDGTTFAEHTVAALAKGASTVISKPLTIAGLQDRTIGVTVDPDNAIVEENEANNAVSKLLNVVAPDLTVGTIGFSNANPGVGDTIEVSATVRNVGLKDATNVVVRFLDEGTQFAQETLATLADGGSATLTKSLLVDGEFDHTITVVADPDGLINEENELNNTASRLLNVVFSAPDLVLGAIGFSDVNPGEGETIQVSVTVTNSGDRDAGAFLVRFFDAATPFADAPLAGLAEGASQAVTRDLLVQGPFDRLIAAVADADLQVNEQDELNNEASRLLDVALPDLVLGAIGFSNPTPGEDDTIQVSVTVSNPGNVSAGAFVLRFLDDGVPFAEATVAGLAQGASQAVTRDLLVVGAFDRTIRVTADALAQVAEQEEANNEASRLLHIIIPDLVLGAGDIALSDPNPDELDTLRVTATVHNTAPGGKVPRDVRVTLVDGGSDVATATIASIPAGSARAATLDHVIAGLGPRTLSVRVDPLNAIRETSDANNQASFGIVVGKVDVAVAMSSGAYPFQQQAFGNVHLEFRNTGTPLANHEFPLIVEYVLGTTTGVPADQLARVAGALLARLAGSVDQHLRACSLDKCVELTTGMEGTMSQLFGGGGGSGPGSELRFRVATIDAKTNGLGNAPFIVPFNGFTAFDRATGLVSAEACFIGFGEVFTALGALPLPASVQPCTTQTNPLPALPAVGNLPGKYRATALVDWHGFDFQGSAEWVHI